MTNTFSSNVIKTGQFFFAVALISFGVSQFIIGDFTVGRAPAWPSLTLGRLWFAYVTGFLMIITGVGIFIRHRAARPMLFLVGILILVWAVIRHIPIVAADIKWGAEITNAGKALVMWGGSFAVAGMLPKFADTSKPDLFKLINQTIPFIYVGRLCLSVFMIIGGIEHFIFLEFVAQLVPQWIPGKIFWTYFTGIALIAGGTGLLVNRIAPLAATLSGIMIFIWLIVLHISRAFTFMNENEWIAVCEALAFSGVAFVVSKNVKGGKSAISRFKREAVSTVKQFTS